MSSRYASSRCIDEHRVAQDLAPSDVVFAPLDDAPLDEIDVPPEETLQFLLDRGELAQPGAEISMRIFVHHEEIDVAVTAEIIARGGHEKPQPPKPPLPAERRDRLGSASEALAQNVFAGHSLAILRRTRRPAGRNGMRNRGPGFPPPRPSAPPP